MRWFVCRWPSGESTEPRSSTPQISCPAIVGHPWGEVLRFGVIGWTMSRATGLWVGMKALADIAGLPLAIKGFGHVKTVSEKQASVRLDILLDRWPSDTHAQIAAE
jgi:hypothetical protein